MTEADSEKEATAGTMPFHCTGTIDANRPTEPKKQATALFKKPLTKTIARMLAPAKKMTDIALKKSLLLHYVNVMRTCIKKKMTAARPLRFPFFAISAVKRYL